MEKRIDLNRALATVAFVASWTYLFLLALGP